MLSTNLVIAAAIGYVALLFGVAALADRQVARGHFRWLQSPLVYTLSLSVYCTAWTFYGAVGSAVRNWLEFAAIYIGPTLLFIGWFWLLRKLVRIGRAQHTTSIADLISTRYGKSNGLAACVTVLAVIASTPYIALQLQSITISFDVLAAAGANPGGGAPKRTAFWVTVGLAIFTTLFGTRNVKADDRHHGVVTAIAVEAIVKLVAVLAVGIFVVFFLYDGPGATFAAAPEDMLQRQNVFGSRWIAITMLAAMAILTLPRMFQVMVVENVDERHLATASWAFPLYLFLMSLFVIPIGIAGIGLLPDANPDFYVLTVPLEAGYNGLALLAFLGGFSAATSMIIVSSIALSIMVSNHLVVPVWLSRYDDGKKTAGDVRGVVLAARRMSIAFILMLGFLYFTIRGGDADLASIGLIAFVGMAQLTPALIGGIFWRGATRQGALWGLVMGTLIWSYTSLLPSFEGSDLLPRTLLQDGPWGMAMLRPHAFLGLSGLDPLVHALFWSLTVNTGLFLLVSLLTTPPVLERLQSAVFVDAFQRRGTKAFSFGRTATTEDLFTLAQRILGTDTAHKLFTNEAGAQGKLRGLPEATPDFIEHVERQLSGSVGAASAHAMVSQISGSGRVSVDDLMNIADETAQILQYSQQLESQSKVLADTARQLTDANTQLRALGAQKDTFLSQVSHELRTPMTSIRSFAEILAKTDDLTSEEGKRFIGIIREESGRLTRILDEILDLSFLESGQINWQPCPVCILDVINRARESTMALDDAKTLVIDATAIDKTVTGMADFDRLGQVFINLFSNTVKYGHASKPVITLTVNEGAEVITLDVHDNGPGIEDADHERVFEKFTRLSSANLSGSAGLGLPISREIMRNLGGDLVLTPCKSGTNFRLTLRKAS